MAADSTAVPMPAEVQVQVSELLSAPQHNLYPMEKEWIASLMKAEGEGDPSGQAVTTGRKEHPFDFEAAIKFQHANEHHGACIQTKVNATVGLGFMSPEDRAQREKDLLDPTKMLSPSLRAGFIEAKADKLLNPLTEKSFHDVLVDVCEDFMQTGNGNMEVVRRGGTPRTTSGGGRTSRTTGNEITGIHHLPSPQAYVVIENNQYDGHFEVDSDEGNPRRFARFGERDQFIKRFESGSTVSAAAGSTGTLDKNAVSEVIHFRRPTSLSRWYGFPDWLGAVPSIELMQMLIQMKFDFFQNRGVPEFILLLRGAMLPKDDWKKVEDMLRATIGIGNQHKSIALNLPQQGIEMQVEKLAVEGKQEDGFKDTAENRSLAIVSAHRVPPLLAGIQIPGKLGANNELPNALMAFQLLVVGQYQRLFQQQLGCTLGDPELNGGLGLTVEDFTFKKITEELDLGFMDTAGRMRQTLPEAQAQGRDMSEGVRD